MKRSNRRHYNKGRDIHTGKHGVTSSRFSFNGAVFNLPDFLCGAVVRCTSFQFKAGTVLTPTQSSGAV